MKKHTRDCITLFIVIVSFFVLFSLLYTRSEDKMEKMKEDVMIDIGNQLESNFDTARIYAELGASFVARDPYIVKMVEQAYSFHNSMKNIKSDNKDEELKKLRKNIKVKYKHMVDLIEKNSNYGIVQSHLHIVNENNKKRPISLFRFHKAEKIHFDQTKDYLYFRKMIIDLHQQTESDQLKPSSGIEAGIVGLGIRGLAPIFNKKGKLIGSFEFGFNHIQLIKKIEADTNTSIGILLEKKLLEKRIPLDAGLHPIIDENDMLYVNSNIDVEDVICNRKCKDVINSDHFREKLRALKRKRSKEKHEYFSEKNHDVYIKPLYDMHDEKIGIVFIMKKI